ncbi:MAG TPA: hypothetical protein VMZ52_08030 [Bryobacteraceae bacterium]|nr:hypothetical protein [Bryobacteraceae bacterium]
MKSLKLALAGIAVLIPCFPATFGTVVPLVGGAADLALDEPRGRLYLVNSSQNRIEVYSIAQRRFLTPIRTDALPLAEAMSRNGRFLYVASYDGSALNVIDLEKLEVSSRVGLPAKPEGVAVGADERVLISTIGSGANSATNVLLVFDPAATTSNSLSAVQLAPPAPALPQLPAPSGRIFLAARSQLLASNDGKYIVGANLPNANSRAVFVYEVASGIVLRSRTIANVSSVLSIAPDGSKFMAGLSLLDTQTLEVLAQQNVANAPYPFPAGTNFNLQQNQGGSVFSPDGQTLYSAFNIAPTQNPPARANVSQLMLNDADNLLTRLGIQLPENLTGQMLISSDGGSIYALSESGFVIIPMSQLAQSPIANPESTTVLLANDQCGVTGGLRTAAIPVRNDGRGRMTASAQLIQETPAVAGGIGGPGGAGGGAPGGGFVIAVPGPAASAAANITASAPQVRAQNGATSSQLDFTFTTAAAARAPGTVSPTHTFLVQSPEAVNIPPAVRVFQNFRDAEAKSELIPVPVALSATEALADMAYDATRNRVYMANSGLNRVEVFDTRNKKLLPPIKVGQLPRSLAISPDGNTMYVANTGGESISIIDLDKGQVVGRVKFPPLPFNLATPLMTPSIVAAGLRGPEVIMNNGTLWKIVNNEAVPRNVSPAIGTNVIPAPRTMVATPNGEYIMLLSGSGFVYLYDSLADEFIQGRQIFTNPIQGFYGPVAAGPRGQYFVANGTLLNQSLTPVSSAGTGTVPGGRPGTTAIVVPISAVAPASATTFVRFSQPVRANTNVVPADPSLIELVDVNSGQTIRSAAALEGPLASAVGNARTNVDGRTMAVDSSGSTVYALTTSGLSIISLVPPAAADRPAINPNGTVSLSSYVPAFAQGSLVSLFGRNLGTSEVFAGAPAPTVMGGVCVTLNNTALPLFMTSTGQINAQIPVEITPGRYTLTVRAIDRKIASNNQSLTIGKYAPGIFTNLETREAAVFRSDGSRVTKESPGKRDEHLTLYASGLGPTKGGAVVTGKASPAEPLAVTDPVELFFGDPRMKEAEVIVDWSGLTPGFIGVYQINLRIPGAHLRGESLPVTLKVGGVNSQTTGPEVPVIAVD